jgi:diguanylate cyclase (GGDEF)-like protein
VLSFLLLIALTNVGLGFGLALYLGRRFRMVTAAANWPMAGVSLESSLAELLHQSGGPATTATATASPATTTGEAQEVGNLDRLALIGVQRALESFTTQVVAIDGLLRQSVPDYRADAVENCLRMLGEASTQFAADRQSVAGRLGELTTTQAHRDELCRELQAALKAEDAELSIIGQGIAAFRLAAGLEDQCRQLLGQVSRLIAASHRLRDLLDRMLEPAAGAAAGQLPGRDDNLTGLANRHGLNADLAAWWSNDPHRLHQLSVALLDVDDFGQINERFGCRVGHDVLHAVGRILLAQPHGALTLARFAGQRFAFLFPDMDAHYATNVMERIRQTVGGAVFRHHQEEIRITVRCAVTEALPDDTATLLLARLEAALSGAKGTGRDQTFLQDGKSATPVAALSFSPEIQHVTL